MTLREYLRLHRHTRFRYGRHDCALFAAGWVLAKTGRDLTLGLSYSSRKDGVEKLQEKGYTDHVAVAAAELPEIPVVRARPGDLALITHERIRTLGVVVGESVAAPGRDGLGMVPLMAAKRAFRVE